MVTPATTKIMIVTKVMMIMFALMMAINYINKNRTITTIQQQRHTDNKNCLLTAINNIITMMNDCAQNCTIKTTTITVITIMMVMVIVMF